MAARQVAKKIDWAQIMQRTTNTNRAMYASFKNKSDAIQGRYNNVADQKVTIDWEFYKQNITDKAWVEDFEKQYTAFKVPYPKDTRSSKLAEKKKADLETYAEFIKTTNEQIKEFKLDVDRINALPPVEQMTVDDWHEHFPALRYDPNDPIYPHTGNAKETMFEPPEIFK